MLCDGCTKPALNLFNDQIGERHFQDFGQIVIHPPNGNTNRAIVHNPHGSAGILREIRSVNHVFGMQHFTFLGIISNDMILLHD